MNISRLKELFTPLARTVYAQREAPQSVPAGPITNSLVIRGPLVLSGKTADDYFTAIQDMESVCESSGIWSKTALDDLLSRSLIKIYEAQDPVERAVRDASSAFVRELQQDALSFIVEWSVFGLDLGCDSLSFGSIQFYARAYTSNLTHPSFLEKGQQVKVLHAQMRIRAINADTATMLGSKLLDKHLSVLNAVLSDPPPSKVRLLRVLENTHSYAFCRTLVNEDEEFPLALQSRLEARFISRNEFVDSLAKRGGDRLNELLTSSTSVAKRIIGAFETAGAACIERQNHIAFLLFTIALESAILNNNSQELTFQLASRTAYLVSSTLEGRRKVFFLVKKLYGLRSKVVHQGSANIVESDLQEVRYLCLTALFAMSMREEFIAFQTSKELEDWFELQTLDSSKFTHSN